MNPIRKTARVVLLNEHNEVLLVKYHDRKPINPLQPHILEYWALPGGGLEDGETFESAAAREIHEETGMTVVIGPCVGTRELALKFDGHLRPVCERYFVAHCQGRDIRDENHGAEGIVAHRWWKPEEISATDETIFPENLAELLKQTLNQTP